MNEVGAAPGQPVYPTDSPHRARDQVDFSPVRAAYAEAIQGTSNPQERRAEVGILSPEGIVSFARIGKDENYGAHRVGSVTKTFTTFLALKLVAKGGIFPHGLDTKCVDIIAPELLAQVFEDLEAAKSMTLAQLLSHTAGLDLDDHCYQPNQNISSLKPPSTLQERFLQESMREGGYKYKHIAKPGDGIGFYSNAGLAVACWMIETAYNKKNHPILPFSEIMKREIFEEVFGLSDSLIAPGPSGDIIQSGAGNMTSSTADLIKVAKSLQKGESELAPHFGPGWQSTMLQGRDIFKHHGLGCEAHAPVIKHFGLNREKFGTEERDVTAVVEFPLNPRAPGLVAMCDSSALGPRPQEQEFIKSLEMAAGIAQGEAAPPKPDYKLEFYCPPKAFLFHGNSYLATDVDPFAVEQDPPKKIICSRNGMKHELTRQTSLDKLGEGVRGYKDEYNADWLFIEKKEGRKIIYSPYCLLTHAVEGIDITQKQPDVASVRALRGVYKNAENPDEHPTFIFSEENGHLYMKEEGDKKSYPCLYIPDSGETGGSWTLSNPAGPKFQFRFPQNPDEDYLVISDIFTAVQQLPHHSKRVPKSD